ncbi:MAG: hypothetical protein PQJ44_06945 [Sphaerochaetaceae bacterium]|nr:hypothetical protein [Sphaerochaetaceae bacterium]
MTSQNPLSYLNNQPKKQPEFIRADRAPTTNDLQDPGTRWQHFNGTTNPIYESEGAGVWVVGGAPPASTTEAGLVELATNAETLALTDATKAVTPANLGALNATTTQEGLGEIATDAEAQSESISTNKFLVPSNLASLKTSTNITFTSNPILQSAANTGAAPVGTDTATNIMICQDGEVMEVTNIGTQTIIAPRMTASGLLTSLDLTDDEGVEYNWGVLANSKHQYTIGTSPAFYLEWRFTLADVTGCDPVGIGFRKTEANDPALANYTDFAWIGVSETDTSGTVSLKTRLNSGSVTTTDTTDTWADGETHTLKILVSGSGVVTYEIDGAAPTATAAFTFDDTDVVMPFFYGLHGTTSPGAWNWVYCKAGVQ